MHFIWAVTLEPTDGGERRQTGKGREPGQGALMHRFLRGQLRLNPMGTSGDRGDQTESCPGSINPLNIHPALCADALNKMLVWNHGWGKRTASATLTLRHSNSNAGSEPCL